MAKPTRTTSGGNWSRRSDCSRSRRPARLDLPERGDDRLGQLDLPGHGADPGRADPHGPEEEHAEIFRIPLSEAIEWIESGKIVDAKTVVGLLLAERRLNRASGGSSGADAGGRRRARSARDRGVPLLDGVRTGRAANTVAAYRRDLTGYAAWLAERGTTLATVSTDDLVDFVAEPAHRGTCRGDRGAAARGDPDASSPSRQRGRAG